MRERAADGARRDRQSPPAVRGRVGAAGRVRRGDSRVRRRRHRRGAPARGRRHAVLRRVAEHVSRRRVRARRRQRPRRPAMPADGRARFAVAGGARRSSDVQQAARRLFDAARLELRATRARSAIARRHRALVERPLDDGAAERLAEPAVRLRDALDAFGRSIARAEPEHRADLAVDRRAGRGAARRPRRCSSRPTIRGTCTSSKRAAAACCCARRRSTSPTIVRDAVLGRPDGDRADVGDARRRRDRSTTCWAGCGVADARDAAAAVGVRLPIAGDPVPAAGHARSAVAASSIARPPA